MSPMKPSADANSPDREQQLAVIFSDLVDRMQGGETIALESATKEFPDFAEDLRELWGTAIVAQAIGSRQSDPEERGATPMWNPVVVEVPAPFGEYDLEEELGRGGMGVVYRARHRESGREVALKMLLQGDMATAANLKRFRVEADAVRNLEYPGIVRILDVGEHEGRAFFCMELIRGETLAARLARGPIPSREAARLLLDIARAVGFAHSRGVLHRDIKPSNILIRAEDHQPIVCDFGLARDVSSTRETLTRSDAILGTPAYMAPEQAAGRRGAVGPASDIYSLGALFYHMLTGRPPFQAASPVDTLLMVLEQDAIAPRVLNRDIDRQLEMITLRCLQKPQDLRYASADHLVSDLGAYLNHESVSAERGRFGHVVANLLKETHHASVLENWGMLWMWHSLALLVACWSTQAMYLLGVENRWYYWLVWTAGFGAWAGVFWTLRRRRGPVSFVERQIAHLWLGSIICVALMFPFEWYLNLPVLKLSPLLALVAGMVFFVKAAILAGSFYIQALVMFGSAFLMAAFPTWAQGIFGVVSSGCFFFAGLKYHRRTLEAV